MIVVSLRIPKAQLVKQAKGIVKDHENTMARGRKVAQTYAQEFTLLQKWLELRLSELSTAET